MLHLAPGSHIQYTQNKGTGVKLSPIIHMPRDWFTGEKESQIRIRGLKQSSLYVFRFLFLQNFSLDTHTHTCDNF